MKTVNYLVVGLMIALLAGCGSPNKGKYFSNDRPPSSGWFGPSVATKDAVPRVDKPSTAANRPYTVMGKRYVPITGDQATVQEGIGSWYGTKFHGKKTSTGEIYDMYAMSAASTTMELPSYARVTNLENGKSVIVRVNDRGPFLHERIIDLSYAAATKLGYANKGTARVRVERITRAQIARGSWGKSSAVAVAAAPVVVSKPAPAPVPAPAPAPAKSTYVAPAPAAAPATKTYVEPPVTNQAAAEYENTGEFVVSDGSGALTKAEQPAVAAAPRAASGYAVQVGAFSSKENAAAMAHRANEALSGQSEARVVEVGGKYKVLVGGNMDATKARGLVDEVSNQLGQKCVLVEDVN